MNLVCFIDVTLDFILSLSLYRFVVKFLLLLRCKPMRVCCQLPSFSAMPLPLSLPEKRLVHLACIIFLSSFVSEFSTLFETSPVTSGSATAERFGCRHRLCLACGDRLSFTVSDFESSPSSSRSWILFSPAVDFALVLPVVCCALSGLDFAVIVLVLLHSFFSPLALWLWFCL